MYKQHMTIVQFQNAYSISIEKINEKNRIKIVVKTI